MLTKPLWKHTGSSRGFGENFLRNIMPRLKYEGWREVIQVKKWKKVCYRPNCVIDAFELWCWRRPLRVPWTARRCNQSILKEISPGISLEGMMLKLKLQYFGHLMWRVDTFSGKDSDAGRDWGQEEKGTTEDEMAGWHHRLDGHEFDTFRHIDKTHRVKTMWGNGHTDTEDTDTQIQGKTDIWRQRQWLHYAVQAEESLGPPRRGKRQGKSLS